MSSEFFDEGFRNVACDGGGWTGCASFIEGGIGDRLSDLRAQGRAKGWRRVKDDGGHYIDLCPACAMNEEGDEG